MVGAAGTRSPSGICLHARVSVHTVRIPAPARWITAYGVSLLGIQIFTVISTWEAARLGGIGAATAVALASAIPRGIMLFIGGPMVDLLGPRFVMLRSDIASVAIMLVGVCLISFIDTLALLIGLSVIVGAVAGISGPAGGSMLPSLVPKDKLPGMNSLNLLAVRGAAIIGPSIGALFIGAGGLGVGMIANAATYLVSFTLVLSIRPDIRKLGLIRESNEQPPKSMLSPIDGYRSVLANPLSRWLLLGVFFLDLGFAWPFNVGLTLMVQHRSWDIIFVSAAIAAFAAGAIFSSLLGLRFLKSRWVISRLIAGQLAITLGLMLMLLAPRLAPWVIACALCGIGSGQSGPMAVSLYQQSVNPQHIGSAMAALTLCSIGTAPLAIAISSTIAALTTIPTAWLVSACITLLAPLAAFRVRHLQTALPS